MKTYIIWGYLGSGKTTLINHLLQTIFKNKKVVIIENEFGETGIDSQLFKDKNYLVKELNAGCICCSLRTELPRIMKEIEEDTPDVVLVEPSGVSSLDELIQLHKGRLDQVITLIDATRLDLLLKLNRPFYERQFQLSSVMLITKTDQITADNINKITDLLSLINPMATIYTDYTKLTDRELEDLFITKFPVFIPLSTNTTKNKSYESLTISIHAVLDKKQIEELITKTTDNVYGSIFRIKGHLHTKGGKTVKVDYVTGKLTLEDFSEPIHPTNLKLCFIGFDLQQKKLSDCIKEQTSFETFVKYDNLFISIDEIHSYLGSNPDTTPLHFQTVINNQLQEIRMLNSLSFGYRMIEGSFEDKSNITLSKEHFNPGRIITKNLEGSDFFILLVATVGEDIDRWLKEKHDKGDVVDIFIADAIASTLVESIVSYALNYLESEMKGEGYRITNSYSPGYCGWLVSEQHKFFSLLPDHFCGISLTDSSLMLPIKSVSAVIGVGERLQRKPYGCAICNKLDCYKRNLKIQK